MNRRSFLSATALAAASAYVPAIYNLPDVEHLVIGHGDFKYKIDMQWGALDPNFYPVNDCHEIVQDSKGRIVMITNETKNNILIYDKSGKLLDAWGTDYPGGHGLTLNSENGEDFLYITDTNRHEVIKTTIDGKVVMTLPYPADSEKYTTAEQYVPTETAIAANGDIYVADGYGAQHIIHYNHKGEIQNIFGGRGEGAEHFDNAHGICIDDRDPENIELLITARQQNALKRFTLDGNLIEVIPMPGAWICRPVVHQQNIFLATIWSGAKVPNSGFISVLDEKNKLVSAPGGNEPIYKGGQLQDMYQTVKVFQHPHDVCIDEDENLYVAQWNSGKSYPIKLVRV